MQMTQQEIVTSFREAKDKKEQIKILSQLNVCSEEEIRSILIKGGIDGRALPRKRRKAEFKLEDEKASDASAEAVQACSTAEGGQAASATKAPIEAPEVAEAEERAPIEIPDPCAVPNPSAKLLKEQRTYPKIIRVAVFYFIEHLEEKIRSYEDQRLPSYTPKIP